jgi:hypothetical protein
MFCAERNGSRKDTGRGSPAALSRDSGGVRLHGPIDATLLWAVSVKAGSAAARRFEVNC